MTYFNRLWCFLFYGWWMLPQRSQSKLHLSCSLSGAILWSNIFNWTILFSWAAIYQFTKRWESFFGREFYPVWLEFCGVRGFRPFKFIFENCYTTCFILWNTMLCHLKDSLRLKFTRKWNMQWDCHRSFKVSFTSDRGSNVTY